jgi:hypothetical protein
LGKTYNGINATVQRDANWNITSITGTVQDPDNTSATLDVTFDGNDISIGGQSVNDMQDNQNSFQEGGSTWTYTDWDNIEWTVVDAYDVDTDIWTSTETSENGDVRTHTSSWNEATNSSTMVETYASQDGQQDFTRTEVYNDDGTSSEIITGKTNQLGWMWLDDIYHDLNVTIVHGWDEMTITGSGIDSNNKSVEFTSVNGELLLDGQQVVISDDFKNDMGMEDNQSQSWESSWEWTDFDNTVWVVTDTQEGEKWSST